jgi:nicotinamide mononucleotide transporter
VNPLSVNAVFFTILGYPMSYIEFFGTMLYLASVWLIARRNVLTWPVGIVSVVLYMVLFYQIGLYSDTLEQVYYLAASGYGWYYWARVPRTKQTNTEVGYSPRNRWLIWGAITVVLSVALGLVMSHVHEWWPTVFDQQASYPYLDALTTVMSLVAMWLMVRKRVESWLYWIIVDAIGIWLYNEKGVRLLSLLYVLLLGLAIRGLVGWHLSWRRKPSHPGTDDQPVPAVD